MTQYERVADAVQAVRKRSTLVPDVALVLGSGLGEFAAEILDPVKIAYSEIPHIAQSTVIGHSGNLVMGSFAGVQIAVLQGRVHLYEGHTTESVTFATRLVAMLGAKVLITTNAAGAINPDLLQGDLVAISDHINLTGTNAAAGPNEPLWGERFFDMSQPYSLRLQQLAIKEKGLKTGVYLAVLGPSFETPAEIRAFRTLGADLVGMSTVHEVIVARHMGLEVLGISLVTNAAAGVSQQTIDHREVLDVGRQAQQQFTSLLRSILPKI